MAKRKSNNAGTSEADEPRDTQPIDEGQTDPPDEFATEETPDEPPEPSPSEELDRRIEKLEAEAADFKDRALRAHAELENYRKRVTRERSESLKYAEQQIVVDLLSVLDNFDRALTATPETEEGKVIRDGLEMVKKSWQKVFRDHHVTEMETSQQPFDPAVHEAVTSIPRNDLEPNTIVEEIRKGYTLHDRVVRAAQVVVSHRDEPAEPSAPSES